jgi:hypothetical protein
MAISSELDTNYVMKVEQRKYKKVPVELWISDQANTEILSGIAVGDTIMGVFIDKEGIEVAGLNEKQPLGFEDAYAI